MSALIIFIIIWLGSGMITLTVLTVNHIKYENYISIANILAAIGVLLAGVIGLISLIVVGFQILGDKKIIILGCIEGNQNWPDDMADAILVQEQSMIEELEALKRISIDRISQKIEVEEKLKGWGYIEKIKDYKEIIEILENEE